MAGDAFCCAPLILHQELRTQFGFFKFAQEQPEIQNDLLCFCVQDQGSVVNALDQVLNHLSFPHSLIPLYQSHYIGVASELYYSVRGVYGCTVV